MSRMEESTSGLKWFNHLRKMTVSICIMTKTKMLVVQLLAPLLSNSDSVLHFSDWQQRVSVFPVIVSVQAEAHFASNFTNVPLFEDVI